MRTMQIWTTTEKIWWDDTTDNKPDWNFFNEFKSRMTSRDSATFGINQVSFDRIEIVVPDTDISYIRIQLGNYNYYYYYNKILNILPEGFRLEFSLDLYATYTLPYLKYLYDNPLIYVKLNRHQGYILDGLQYEDEMLEKIPKIVKERKWRTTRTSKWYPAPKFTPDSNRYTENRLNCWDGYIKIWNVDYGLITPSTYLAYNHNNYIYLLPCVASHYNVRGGIQNNLGIHFPYGSSPSWYSSTNHDFIKENPNDSDTWYQIINNQDIQGMINLISQITTVANPTTPEDKDKNKGAIARIIGAYTGPPVYSLDRNSTDLIFLGSGSSKKAFFGIKIEASKGVNTKGRDGSYSLGVQPEYISNDAPSHLNQEDKLSIFASNYINLTVNGQSYKLFTLKRGNRTSNDIYLGEYAVFNFTSSGFMSVRSKWYGMFNMNLLFTEDLPIVLDSYLMYLQATKNTRDTGVNIAKQQLELSRAQNTVNTIGGLIGGVASQSAGGIARTITNSIFADKAQTLGYQSKIDMITADLADKKATLKSQIQSGTVRDASLATYLKVNVDNGPGEGEIYTGDFIEYDEFQEQITKSLNNVLYLYGQYFPWITWFSYPWDSKRAFNYFQFDSEYLSNIFTTTIRGADEVPIQREYYDYIFNQLTAGIRLWKQKPYVGNYGKTTIH